jgi:hypothetical protein
VFSKVAILAARERGLREEAHSHENAYIRFVNDCDPDRYLDVLLNDTLKHVRLTDAIPTPAVPGGNSVAREQKTPG